MLTGLPPNWDDEKDQIAIINIIARTDQIPEFPEDLSDVARDFLLRCLDRNTKMREKA